MKRLRKDSLIVLGLAFLAVGALLWRDGSSSRGESRRFSLAEPVAGGRADEPEFGSGGYSLTTTVQGPGNRRRTATEAAPLEPDPAFPHRLRNTRLGLDELLRRPGALSLHNALIDTASARPLPVPEPWRAAPDTRSWLIQTVGPFAQALAREDLERWGVLPIAYVPNDAWLARTDPETARRLAGRPEVRAVLPFEPYFKLGPSLLGAALERPVRPGPARFRLTTFPDAHAAVGEALERLGADWTDRGETTAFGRVLEIQVAWPELPEVAALDGVFLIEPPDDRQLANDLTRVRLGVDFSAANTVNSNLHDLNGEGILLNVNDTGVDAGHPDLAGRMTSVAEEFLTDEDGHGTYISGIIASSGENSPTVEEYYGSLEEANFHGMAPKAEIFLLPINLTLGPLTSDENLQYLAATRYYEELERTNVLISNNSWGSATVTEYDSRAATWDAATRDALPELAGEQPILFVFGGGNRGDGNHDGSGGTPGSVRSPSTAKNVITVGALESFRSLTNELFLPRTDSSSQVASYSARGNVGIGVEGEGGRFKPDVVAPGSFLASTRAAGGGTPNDGIDRTPTTISNQIGLPGALAIYTAFVPGRTVSVTLEVLPNDSSPQPLPQLPLYASLGTPATVDDLVGHNEVTLTTEADSPLILQPGLLHFSVGNPTEVPVPYDVRYIVAVESGQPEYYEQLDELNERLAPHYQFASGTSGAAATVSGLLALVQQFFEERQLTTSPALLKALLINGARSVDQRYDFQIDPTINYQGWGLINLIHTLPSGLAEAQDFWTGDTSLRFRDQDPEDALATGEQRSWNLELADEEYRARPLRFTLVWTDPPGNPTAGVKLVNDLDLIVSNRVSGEVFYGNDFPRGTRYTAGSTNDLSRADRVNNVENVFLAPPLGTNYLVTVAARRVNVNAVTEHPDGIVQDYALVISWGDNPELEESPFTLEDDEGMDYIDVPEVIAITNGIPRLNDRVGANAPLLEGTNGLAAQWKFYTFTNSPPSLTNDLGFTNGPNVAFVTFLPPNLSRPRNRESDIDLYVTRNAELTNLSDEAIAETIRGNLPAGIGVSRNSGGTESVIFTNQALGDDQIYYIGVKAEDQQAGQYALVGISQEEPFDLFDPDGNRIIRGVPLNRGVIPDGSPNDPGANLTIGLGNPLFGMTIRAVQAELSLDHEDIGDLFGNLTHNGRSIVLNNHTLYNPQGLTENLNIVYDDLSNEASVARTDGPGSLVDYIGEQGEGVWLMTQIDNALSHTGRVNSFTLTLVPNRLVEGQNIAGTVQPRSFSYHVVDVPTDASALLVDLIGLSEPLDLYLRREALPTLSQYDKRILGAPGVSGLTLKLTRDDVPPLSPGRYFIGVYNPHYDDAIDYQLKFNLERNLAIDAEQPFYPEEFELSIKDDAVSYSTVFVADNRSVADVKVGLRLDHSRAADLSIHLVSPSGTRVLLVENRGGLDADGWGAGDGETISYGGFSDDADDAEYLIKFAPLPWSVPSQTKTNRFSGFEQAPADTAYVEGETFPANEAGDEWEVTGGEVTVMGGDLLVPEGTNYLELGPSRLAAEVKLETGRTVELSYAFRSRESQEKPLGTLRLNGVQAQVLYSSSDWRRSSPVKFTPREEETLLEWGGLSGRPSLLLDDIVFRDAPAVKFFHPEEELRLFDGERALGTWTLELADRRAGPVDEKEPILKTWQLMLSLAATNFPAATLRNGQCVDDEVSGSESRFYIVDVPRSATMATNRLTAEGELTLLWSQEGVPREADSAELAVDFGGAGGGEVVLGPDGVTVYDDEGALYRTWDEPRLQPGARYYLGVINSDPEDDSDNEYELCLRFDQDDLVVIDLVDGVFHESVIPSFDLVEYHFYRFRAGRNVIRLDIDVFPLDGNVDAVAKYDWPLPNLRDYDWLADNAGTAPERITIAEPDPATIRSGDYLIGVYNAEPGARDVAYRILATATTVPYEVVHLDADVPFADTLNPAAEPERYYMLAVDDPEVSALRFDFFNLNGSAEVALKRDGLPSFTDDDRLAFADPERPGSGRMVVRTNASRPDLSGRWFVALRQTASEPLDFTILGAAYTDEVPVNLLPNFLWVTNTVVPTIAGEARERDYYLSLVYPQATEAAYLLEPLFEDADADLELQLRQGDVPKDLTSDFVGQPVAGGSAQAIFLGSAGGEEDLEPGLWYLAVVNGEEQPVTYRIRAEQELVLEAIPLEDGVWETGTIAANPDGRLPLLELYEFVVDERAESVTFELEATAPGGNLKLTARRGLFPDLDQSPATSRNPGDQAESITLYRSDSPPLEPGRWYLGVYNREASEVAFRIRASQTLPPDAATGYLDPALSFVADELCLTWDSIPGVEYIVMGKTRIDDPLWDGLRRVTAAADETAECFPQSGPYRFFRIFYRVDDPADEEFLAPELIVTPETLCLAWEADLGTVYSVQAKRSVEDPDWTRLKVIEAGQTNQEYCLSRPTEFRQFRIAVGDERPVYRIEPELTVADGRLCLSWAAEPGYGYVVEGKRNLGEQNWSDIGSTAAISNAARYCLELPIDQRYFRIRRGLPVVAGPIEPELTVADGRLCLSWAAEPGSGYVVEGKRNLAEASWSDIGSMTAASTDGRYCLELPTDHRYFRVRPDQSVVELPIEPLLTVVDDRLCLSWPAEIGKYYRVEGKRRLTDSAWSSIASTRTDTAPGEYCLELTTEFRHFRILRGSEPPGYPELQIEIDSDRICLEWLAERGRRYEIEAKSDLGSPWTPVESVTFETPDASYCLPLRDGYRFFRVKTGTTDPPDPGAGRAPDVSISWTDGRICLGWQTVAGRAYAIEAKAEIDDSRWIRLQTLKAQESDQNRCLDRSATYRFYRVVEIDENELNGITGPEVLELSVRLDAELLCLDWLAKVGAVYEVQRKTALTAGDWETVRTVAADEERETVCFPTESPEAFFRVVVP